MAEATQRAAPLSRAESLDVKRRRRGRNWALFVVLIGVCALFYMITMARLGALVGHG